MDLVIWAGQLRAALRDLLEAAILKPGEILIVGGSTSEVLGKTIGAAPNLEVAETLLGVLRETASREKIFLAIQCCEHLNRALVVEREARQAYNLEEVAVAPVLHAGGAMAAAAYRGFHDPLVVESLKAHAGLDIGGTFIGMHLRPVVVSVASEIKFIGAAPLKMARTRPKFIGGERAVYRV